MKIEPRPAAHHEDTTAEFEAGTAPGAPTRVHRRTTVTVERETLSFLIRRPVEERPDPPADGERVPKSPEKQDKRTGGEPS